MRSVCEEITLERSAHLNRPPAKKAGAAEEIRCISCGVLLAKRDENGLSIQRGDLQATFDGDFHAAFVCYRPRCRKLNVLRMSSERNTKPVGPAA